MSTPITASRIHPKNRRFEGEVNGRWVIDVSACPYGLHPAGTLVADAAPDEPLDLTFTAANGKRYWDTEQGTKWTPLIDPVPTTPTLTFADVKQIAGEELGKAFGVFLATPTAAHYYRLEMWMMAYQQLRFANWPRFSGDDLDVLTTALNEKERNLWPDTIAEALTGMPMHECLRYEQAK